MNEVQRLIQAYGDKYGFDVSRNTHVPLDHDRHRMIADAFHAMKHDPTHPDVVRSYAAMRPELEQQYEHALRHGFRFTPWMHEGQPYATSNDMMDDVLGNKHLYYFRTNSGFGQDKDDYQDHPLLSPAPYHTAGYDATHNDLLRAVHDLYGHAGEGHNFSPTGEDRAWHAHLQMFHPDSHLGLTLNTRAQNAWVNHGPHMRRPDGSLPRKGDHDWVPLANRPFAEQKNGPLPSWVMTPHWGLSKAVDGDPGGRGRRIFAIVKAQPFASPLSEVKRPVQEGNWPREMADPHLRDYLEDNYGLRGPAHIKRVLRTSSDDPRDWHDRLDGDIKDDFREYLENEVPRNKRHGIDGPPSATLLYQGVRKPGWSIHFTDRNGLAGIPKTGFRYGHQGYPGVHLTTWKPDKDRLRGPGFNYAFEAGDPEAGRMAAVGDEGYGQHAIVFPSGGINTYHTDDEQNQHIFHGPSVDPMHAHGISSSPDGKTWTVRDAMGRHRFTGDFDAAVQHVIDNHEQLGRAKVKAWGSGLVPGVDARKFRTYRPAETWSTVGPRPTAMLPKAVAVVLKAGSLGSEISGLKRWLTGDVDTYNYAHLLPQFFEEKGMDDEDVKSHLGLDSDDPWDWHEAMADHELKRFSDYVKDHTEGGVEAAPQTSLTPRKSYDKPGWAVHFTDNPDAISRGGFKYGHPDYEGIHLTRWKPASARMREPGFNFAYHLGGRSSTPQDADNTAENEGYGQHAVVFPSGGFTAFHAGDDEDQHIFHGPTVDPMHIHPIHRDSNGDWNVEDAAGTHRFTGGFEDAVRHVINNHEQLGRAKVRAWGRTSTGMPNPSSPFHTYRSPEVWSSAGPKKPGLLPKAVAVVMQKAHRTGPEYALAVIRARKRVAADPTPAQIEAGNYGKGHFHWRSMDISIEVRKGARRRKGGLHGRPVWTSPPMLCDYGQFVGEKPGRDGDPVDVFIGPDLDSEIVFVINQVRQNGQFDEHKVAIGFRSMRDAKAAYLGSYPEGWTCGKITPMTLAHFKEWLRSGDRSRPATATAAPAE